MTSVGLEPQWYTLHFFLLLVRHISSHKMTSVDLEPVWHITQLVVFTTGPLARCWKFIAINLFTLIFFSSWCNLYSTHLVLQKLMTSVRLEAP
jgi:hypothetical protein